MSGPDAEALLETLRHRLGTPAALRGELAPSGTLAQAAERAKRAVAVERVVERWRRAARPGGG